jgi:hypothetical protein
MDELARQGLKGSCLLIYFSCKSSIMLCLLLQEVVGVVRKNDFSRPMIGQVATSFLY